MNGQDRLSYDDYPDSLRDNHDIDLWGGVEESWHEFVTPRIKEQFEQSQFWTRLGEKLTQWNEEFLSAHNSFALMRTTNLPEINTKSYDSSVNKSYRYNVVNNPRWPFPRLASLVCG